MFCSNVPFSLLVFKWSPQEPFKDHQGALVLLGAESPSIVLAVTNLRSRLSEEGLCVGASVRLRASLAPPHGTPRKSLDFPPSSGWLLSVGAEWLFCFPTIMCPLMTSGLGTQGVWCS